MKKFFQLLACALFILVAASCSQGSAAINKAYDQACQAETPEKIATTLCNGDIDCSALSDDEVAKLGAVLDYLTSHGMYSANFEAQVDMYEFGKLLNAYRALEQNQSDEEKAKIQQLVNQIQVN